MKQILWVLILILCFCLVGFAQNDQCQEIEVQAPSEIRKEVPFDVTASFKGIKQPINSSVNWKIIKGNEINVRIADEPVSVDTKGTKLGDEIVILAEINSEKCKSLAVKRVLITDIIDPIEIDRHGKIGLEAEKARLDNVVYYVQQFDKETGNPGNNKLSVFLYFVKNTPNSILRKRLERILKYLSKAREIKKEKIIFVLSESEIEESMYRYLPSALTEGTCSYNPCFTINGEDFDKLANLFQPNTTKNPKK
jgi:hypothetical protein